jgi:hypothetical protein
MTPMMGELKVVVTRWVWTGSTGGIISGMSRAGKTRAVMSLANSSALLNYTMSDLFLLPWIKHCPIHQCELTAVCPECKNPWPNITSINSRSCSCCGRLSLKQIQYVNEIDNTKYRTITEIYKIITSHEHASVCLDVNTSITSCFDNYTYK